MKDTFKFGCFHCGSTGWYLEAGKKIVCPKCEGRGYRKHKKTGDSQMKMTPIELTNDFHQTEARINVVDGKVTPRQIRQVKEKLCGIRGCKCGGDLSESPPRWMVGPDGTLWII